MHVDQWESREKWVKPERMENQAYQDPQDHQDLLQRLTNI